MNPIVLPRVATTASGVSAVLINADWVSVATADSKDPDHTTVYVEGDPAVAFDIALPFPEVLDLLAAGESSNGFRCKQIAKSLREAAQPVVLPKPSLVILDEPTGPGMWWARWKTQAAQDLPPRWEVVQVIRSLCGILVCSLTNRRCTDREWIGPIEPPAV